MWYSGVSLLPQSPAPREHQDAPSKGARFQPLNQAEVGFSRSRFFAHPYAKHNPSFPAAFWRGMTEKGGEPQYEPMDLDLCSSVRSNPYPLFKALHKHHSVKPTATPDFFSPDR